MARTVALARSGAERITRGEAEDIAVFLPRELRPALTSAPDPAEAFDRAEFIRRVAEREGVDDETAAEHARAVFTALGVAVAPGELRDMMSQLPADYEPLLAAASTSSGIWLYAITCAATPTRRRGTRRSSVKWATGAV